MEVILDRPVAESEWDALPDPPGGRYEILRGQLVVSPSSNARHNRVGEDLADLFRFALSVAGLDYPVTIDVEWRTVAADVVTEAPRGDVVVGRPLDPLRAIHVETPLLVAEIWAVQTSPARIAAKRAYWKDQGLDHYWEVIVGADEHATDVSVWRLGSDRLPRRVVGIDTVELTEPFPISVTPATILGTTQRLFNNNIELANENSVLADEKARLTIENSVLADEAAELRRRLAELDPDF